MNDFIIIALCGIATIFILLAAIGILRMPDFYLRLSVTVKATTFGIGLILVAAAIFFGDTSTTTKVMSIIFFLVLTAPVAAHMIGRAAYFIGVPLWKKSVLDELKHKYNMETHELSSMEKTGPDNDAKKNQGHNNG